MNLPPFTVEPLVLLVGWPGRGRDALVELVRTRIGSLALGCADSGLLALKQARENTVRAVIISSLPDLEVIELVSQLKQHHSSARCMVITERADVQRDALLAGADVVMPPGTPWGQLLPMVQKIITPPALSAPSSTWEQRR